MANNNLLDSINKMTETATQGSKPVNKTIKYGFTNPDAEKLFRDKMSKYGGFNAGEKSEKGDFEVSAPYNHKNWKELDDYARQINTYFTQDDLKRLDELNKVKGYQPFKLDKKKYPDVKTTPYGFIYNVGNSSITDLAEQDRAFKGDKFKFDPNKKYGFSRTTDSGDEVIHDTFEDAYNAVKGKNNPSQFSKDKVDDNLSKKSATVYPTQEEWRKNIEPKIEQRVKEYAKSGMTDKQIVDELYDEFAEHDIVDKYLNQYYGEYKPKADALRNKIANSEGTQRSFGPAEWDNRLGVEKDEDYERSYGPARDEDDNDNFSYGGRTGEQARELAFDDIEYVVENQLPTKNYETIDDMVKAIKSQDHVGSSYRNLKQVDDDMIASWLEGQGYEFIGDNFDSEYEDFENSNPSQQKEKDIKLLTDDAYSKYSRTPREEIEKIVREEWKQGRDWDEIKDAVETRLVNDPNVTGSNNFNEVNVPFQNGIKGRVVGRNGDVSTIEYKTNGGITRREAFYNSDIEKANRTNNPTQNNYDRFNQSWSKFVNSQGTDQDHEQFLKETTEIFGSPAEAFKALAEKFKGQYK
jgi:hypothetical protein